MNLNRNTSPSDNERANEILEVILAYARMDFRSKVDVKNDGNILDGIGSGVNMLGEELQHSTISLKEKEQLIKEIHHRVKNNMQIISSLLSLQSDTTNDSKFIELLNDIRNRINSMSIVHEMLYKSKDLSSIKLKDYIETLSTSIYRSFSFPDSKIEFIYKIDESAKFDVDKMILIGLILNETISNSLKHAFPDRKGEIELIFTSVTNKYVLIIKDNGCGFKDGFDKEKDSNLGMQLIYMLAEQLGGELELVSNNGVYYKLSFQ